MTLIPRLEKKNCFIACDEDRVKRGLCDCVNRIQNQALNIHDVSNFVLLSKPNYKAKDGTIKRGIEIGGKYYDPQNDC